MDRLGVTYPPSLILETDTSCTWQIWFNTFVPSYYVLSCKSPGTAWILVCRCLPSTRTVMEYSPYSIAPYGLKQDIYCFTAKMSDHSLFLKPSHTLPMRQQGVWL